MISAPWIRLLLLQGFFPGWLFTSHCIAHLPCFRLCCLLCLLLLHCASLLCTILLRELSLIGPVCKKLPRRALQYSDSLGLYIYILLMYVGIVFWDYLSDSNVS